MNEQDDIQQELDRLIAEDLPKAENDYKDLARIRETNRRAEEQSNGNR